MAEDGSRRCKRVCYLTEYGQQSWMKTGPLRSRLVWHRGIITMESRFRTGRARRSAWKSSFKWLWIHGASLVVVATLLLVATASVVWIWHTSHQEEEMDYSDYYEPDVKVTRMLQSLKKTDFKSQPDRYLANNDNITILFPWLRRNNMLPNYFFGGENLIDRYETTSVVFIHQHRSPSRYIVRCLSNITNTKQQYLITEWHEKGQHITDNKFSSKPEHQQRTLHFGPFVMGLCDKYHYGGCSYVSVFQEPMSRAVSSYYHCQSSQARSSDELCQTLDARDVTLRDWILVQGSLTFQQLVLDTPWCRQFDSPTENFSVDGSTLTVASIDDWPCWLKRRHFLSQLPSGHYSKILDYVLDHLDQWLGVVGLAEDWRTTIGIIEQVYKLPLTECSGLTSLPADAIDQHSNRVKRDNRQSGYYDEYDPEYLRYDYFVRQALDADMKIYKKAKQIFNVQRQMIYNQINR